MRSSLSFFKIGFFVLVVLNLILIFLLIKPRGPGRDGPPTAQMIIKRLSEKLKLDTKQREELTVIFEKHEKQRDSLFQNSDDIRDKMMICLTNGDNCDSLWHASANSVNFEKSMFDHHRRILSILNADQKKLYIDNLKTRKKGGPKRSPNF